MSFAADRHWENAKKKNPALADPESKLTLTVAELERIMRRSVEVGEKVGFEYGVASANGRDSEFNKRKMDLFFDAFFGGLKQNGSGSE